MVKMPRVMFHVITLQPEELEDLIIFLENTPSKELPYSLQKLYSDLNRIKK